jgi:hypothetical protein
VADYRLVLRGREVWCLEAGGREYVLAWIPEHLTPEQWLRTVDHGWWADRG